MATFRIKLDVIGYFDRIGLEETIMGVLRHLFMGLRELIFKVRKWAQFLSDLLTMTQEPFYLMSRENWHFIFDHHRRGNLYRHSIVDSQVVRIDLNSRPMIWLLIRRMGNPAPVRLSRAESESIERNFLDRISRSNPLFVPVQDLADRPNFVQAYRHRLDRVLAQGVGPTHSTKVKGLMLSDLFLGLVIMEASYSDWAWALLCWSVGKTVVQPESGYGTLIQSHGHTDGLCSLLKEESSQLDPGQLSRAEKSLSLRVAGDYSESPLSLYMETRNGQTALVSDERDLPSDGSIVLFLHVMHDAPNGHTYEYGRHTARSFFELTLEIFSWVISTGRELTWKPHPNGRHHELEWEYLSTLRQLTRKHELIREASPAFAPRDLTRVQRPTVLTGRGSVISECAFLGIHSYHFYRSVYGCLGLSTYVSSVQDLDRVLENDLSANGSSLREAAIRLEGSKQRLLDAQLFNLGFQSKTGDRNPNFPGAKRL